MRLKYQSKSEQYYDSYNQVIKVANQARVVCALRTERELYTPYLALSEEGADYSPNNIERQLQYLYKLLEETLVILKDVD